MLWINTCNLSPILIQQPYNIPGVVWFPDLPSGRKASCPVSCRECGSVNFYLIVIANLNNWWTRIPLTFLLGHAEDILGCRLSARPCIVIVIHPVDVVIILALSDVGYARPYSTDEKNACEHHTPHSADYLNAKYKGRKESSIIEDEEDQNPKETSIRRNVHSICGYIFVSIYHFCPWSQIFCKFLVYWDCTIEI